MSVPDYSHEAEQSVLGALLIDSAAYWRICGDLKREDFHLARHKLIFDGITGVHRLGGDPDAVTVSDFLSHDGELELAGGLEYIGSIANNTPSAANIRTYARIVRDYGKKRRAKATLADALNRVSDGEDLDAVIGSVFSALESDTAGDATADFGSMLEEAIKSAETASKLNHGELLGVPTTFPKLDRLTGGFHGQRLIILGGRPGTYKSALVWQIAIKAGKKSIPIGIISLEMGGAELGTRALANELKLDGQSLAFGNRQVIEQARNGLPMMSKWPVYADFSASNIGKATARILEWKHKHGIKLAIIDHIQLTDRSKQGNRHHDLAEFSRAMKQLAMRINTPILLVSQISRSVEQENRRPMNSDLRESGDLEQNADIILFTHKDTSGEQDKYELILSKQRGGPAGRVMDMWVSGESYRVGEIDEAYMAVAV